MDLSRLLPHASGALNVVVAVLLQAALVAVRTGRKTAHGRLMVSAVIVGLAFLVLYALQWVLVPHRRFPGNDWMRIFFVTVLATHELMALIAVPLIWRTVALARTGRFVEHRRIVRFTYPVWMYLAVTGVVIYVLRNHVRPG